MLLRWALVFFIKTYHHIVGYDSTKGDTMVINTEVYPNNWEKNKAGNIINPISLSVTINVDNVTFTILLENNSDVMNLISNLSNICSELANHIENQKDLQNQFMDNQTLGMQIEKTERFGGDGFSGEEKL